MSHDSARPGKFQQPQNPQMRSASRSSSDSNKVRTSSNSNNNNFNRLSRPTSGSSHRSSPYNLIANRINNNQNQSNSNSTPNSTSNSSSSVPKQQSAVDSFTVGAPVFSFRDENNPHWLTEKLDEHQKLKQKQQQDSSTLTKNETTRLKNNFFTNLEGQPEFDERKAEVQCYKMARKFRHIFPYPHKFKVEKNQNPRQRRTIKSRDGTKQSYVYQLKNLHDYQGIVDYKVKVPENHLHFENNKLLARVPRLNMLGRPFLPASRRTSVSGSDRSASPASHSNKRKISIDHYKREKTHPTTTTTHDRNFLYLQDNLKNLCTFKNRKALTNLMKTIENLPPSNPSDLKPPPSVGSITTSDGSNDQEIRRILSNVVDESNQMKAQDIESSNDRLAPTPIIESLDQNQGLAPPKITFGKNENNLNLTPNNNKIKSIDENNNNKDQIFKSPDKLPQKFLYLPLHKNNFPDMRKKYLKQQSNTKNLNNEQISNEDYNNNPKNQIAQLKKPTGLQKTIKQQPSSNPTTLINTNIKPAIEITGWGYKFLKRLTIIFARKVCFYL